MYSALRSGLLLTLIFLSLVLTPQEGAGTNHSDLELRIALLLWRGETDAEQGFRTRLEELNYHVVYEVYNANQDIKNLGQILLNLNRNMEEFDYIYTFGTTVSRRAKVIIKRRVPQVFNVVTDPVGAGIVHSFEAPGDNISGVSDAIPIAHQLISARSLFDFRKLALLFNPREKNSMLNRKELQTFAAENEIEIIDLRCPPLLDMLDQNLQELAEKKDEIDAVYLPPDSFLVSKARRIGENLRKSRVKSIGSLQTFIDNGALIGVVVDYYHLGTSAAEIIHQHRKGMELGAIPVRRGLQTTLVINQTTATALDIKIPEEIVYEAVQSP